MKISVLDTFDGRQAPISESELRAPLNQARQGVFPVIVFLDFYSSMQYFNRKSATELRVRTKF